MHCNVTGPARMPAQPSKHRKRSSPGGTRVRNQKRLLTRADKGIYIDMCYVERHVFSYISAVKPKKLIKAL